MEIPQAKRKPMLKQGLHLVYIVAIKPAVNKDDQAIHDKNGNPALRITFETKENYQFFDTIYYGSENIQWVLDGLMAMIGVDNVTSPVTEDIIQSEVIKKEIWIAILEEKTLNSDNTVAVNQNGNQMIYYNRFKFFQYYGVDGVKPALLDKEFFKVKYKKGASAAPPVQTTETIPDPLKAKGLLNNDADTAITPVVVRSPEVEDDLPF